MEAARLGAQRCGPPRPARPAPGMRSAGRGILRKQGLPAQPSAAAHSSVLPSLTAATTIYIYI